MNAKIQDDELRCRNAMRTLTRRAGCLIPCLLAFLLIGPGYVGAQNSTTVGAVEGGAFIVDSSGPSYVPGAGVVLTGSRTLETIDRCNRQLQVSPSRARNLQTPSDIPWPSC